MMVSPDRRLVFVEVPKTASTAVTKHLDKYGWRQERLPGTPPSRHSYFTPATAPSLRGPLPFGVVRNPWDRMASLWRASAPETVPFVTYMESHRFKAANVSVMHFQQFDWLFACDLVLHYETLADDWKAAVSLYGLPAGPIAPVNVSQRRTEPEWTQRALDLVAYRFADDIKRWGYTGPGTRATHR